MRIIIRRAYYKLFLMPDSMITFISGIFISVSTGIFTCAIPQSLSTVGTRYIISAILMFIASLSLMEWAVFIKPIHDIFCRDPFNGPENNNDWYAFIVDPIREKQMTKIHICFIVTFVSVLLCILLWVMS